MIELKILPEYFEAVQNRTKRFEVRRNDRNFKIGDIVILKEWNSNSYCYTGREIKAVITYILDNEVYCKEGFVIFGFMIML